MEKPWHLRHINLFESLSQDELKGLVPLVPFRRYPSGRMLYGPGDCTDVLYSIAPGQVALSMVSVEVKERILGHYSGLATKRGKKRKDSLCRYEIHRLFYGSGRRRLLL